MSTVMDMGFWMARCTIEKDSAELFICAPPAEDEPIEGLLVTGLDAIIALRNCIDEEIARLGERLELENGDMPQ